MPVHQDGRKKKKRKSKKSRGELGFMVVGGALVCASHEMSESSAPFAGLGRDRQCRGTCESGAARVKVKLAS